MPNVVLPSINTDAGVLCRLFIAENLNPASTGYDEGAVNTSMGIMGAVVSNRLANRPGQFGAPGATTWTDIITAPGQFNGFGRNSAGDVVISASVNARIEDCVNRANAGAPGPFARFIQNAIANTTGPFPDPYSQVRDIGGVAVIGGAYGWRTNGASDPGGRFVKIPDNLGGRVAGQRFYTLSDENGVNAFDSATGVIGVDSSVPVTPRLFASVRQQLGKTPVYWGRYFKEPGNSNSIQYQRSEASIFRANNLRLLPFARQTNVVGGDEATGQHYGRQHAHGFIENLGVEVLAAQSDRFYIFLDVEPRGDGPALSVAYYKGWSQGLRDAAQTLSGGRFVLLPGVYLNRNDHETSVNLQSAMDGGATCSALAIANGVSSTLEPPVWSDHRAQPATPVDAPVVLWQYHLSDTGVDAQELNPTFPDVLRHLAIPQ